MSILLKDINKEDILIFIKNLKQNCITENNKIKVKIYDKIEKQLEKLSDEEILNCINKKIKIDGIGIKTIDKIKEFITNNEYIIIKQNDEIYNITNIGPVFANKLINEYKISTYYDVYKLMKDNILLFTYAQKIGILYHKDLKTPVDRNIIKIVGNQIIEYFNPTYGKIVGSYRRKKLFSKDIDILMINPSNIPSLNLNIKKYIDNGNYPEIEYDFIVVSKGKTRLSLLWNYEGFHIQVDVRIILENQLIPGLIYFTGSKDHNIELRLKAKELGYKLNEYDLININTNEKILLNSEKELYDFLNLEYIKPNKR